MKSLLYPLLALLMLLSACTENPGTRLTTSPLGLVLDMSGAPENVSSVEATLSRSGFATQAINLAIVGSTASGSFGNVAAGVWHLRVDALDDSATVLYTGQTDVTVVGGSITNVDLFLNPANGSISINVHWGPGAAGNALHLDGIDDWAEVLNSASLDSVSVSLTMEAWVRASEQYYNTVVSKASKDYAIEFAKGLRPGLMLRGPAINYSGAENFYGRLVLYQTIPADQWTHLAVTFKANGNLKVYRNGAEVYSTTSTGSLAPVLGENLGIGVRIDPSYPEYLKGDIDELRIWNVERSAGEISANYNQELTGSEPGLIAYWNFNEVTGSAVVADQTSNGNDATLRNGAQLVPSGAF